MSVNGLSELETLGSKGEETGGELRRILAEAKPSGVAAVAGVVVGNLIGIKDEGHTPLVQYPSQSGSAALSARTVIDLHGSHIGRNVVLMFEDSDPSRPIIVGVLREGNDFPLVEQPGQVEVDVDGQRLIVSAKEQVVLRCGKASITLTKAGKILIDGTYVLSRSSGTNRIKGGSVQIN
jgi:hypothetical protein